MRKIPTGWHRGRAHGLGVVRSAGVLYEAVEPGSEQHLLQAVVEDVARRARHLGPRHHQVALTIALSTHRHSQTPVQSPRTIDSDQADFVNGLLRLSAVSWRPSAVSTTGVSSQTQAAPGRLFVCLLEILGKEKPAEAIPFAAPAGLLRGSPWGASPRLRAMIAGAG